MTPPSTVSATVTYTAAASSVATAVWLVASGAVDAGRYGGGGGKGRGKQQDGSKGRRRTEIHLLGGAELDRIHTSGYGEQGDEERGRADSDLSWLPGRCPGQYEQPTNGDQAQHRYRTDIPPGCA